MDTVDLETILRNDPVASKQFVGVYPRDVVARVIPNTGSGIYIFNTHPRGMSGEHWIAVHVRRNGQTSYFDSYGRHPSAYPLVAQALRDVSNTVAWNSLTLQGFTTTVCGDYCLLFALLSAHGCTLVQFLSTLTRFRSSEIRDHAVRDLICQLFGYRSVSAYRNNRSGLVGIDNLHIKRLVDLLGYV